MLLHVLLFRDRDDFVDSVHVVANLIRLCDVQSRVPAVNLEFVIEDAEDFVCDEN